MIGLHQPELYSLNAAEMDMRLGDTPRGLYDEWDVTISPREQAR
ncbi:hypothetical protein [Methylobacterium tarhaniae]